MNHLQKQVIEDAELVLTDKEHTYLGPDLGLHRCRIVLRTHASALTIADVQLLNCQVEAKKKLSNFQMWCGAAIKDCIFRGRFEGNDFGCWPEQHPNGSIESCDFGESILDGCRFMGCNIESIKLPKWPCFTVTNPCNLQNAIESVKWPGKLRFWAIDLPSQPNGTAGLAEYAPTLAKQFDCTEEELREALSCLGNVRM